MQKLNTERAVLADAIAARSKAERELADNKAKIEQFERDAAAARDAEAVARRKSENAATDRIRCLVDGLPADADPNIRVTLEVAQENVLVTREAVRILKERLVPYEDRLARANEAVRLAVNGLLGAIVGEILNEAEDLRTALEAKRCALAGIHAQLYDPRTGIQSAACSALEEYLGRIPFPLELGRDPSPASHPAYLAWSTAAAALGNDPTAALPA